MASNTLISIIVPTYNTEPYLDQCLTSISNQTYTHLEILCINDGSTDNSLAIMEKHAMNDERIRVINKNNQGYGATCNRGIDEARGEWISIVEPDDWIEPDMYGDMIAFGESFEHQNKPLDIIKTPYWRIWLPDCAGQRKLNCSYRGRIKPAQQPFSIQDAAHLLSHHPSIWSAIYRKSFINNRHIRFRKFPGAGWADNPFLIETLCQTKRIGYIDQPYYCYREETPEKAKSFAISNTLLPLDRWNDMMDILEQFGIRDERILRAHNSRGFTYLSGILEESDLSNKDIRTAATHMFSRMDKSLVLEDSHISPGCKEMFCTLLTLPRPKINRPAYFKNLISESFYNLHNVGPAFTLYTINNYLKKRKKRTGKN